MRTHSWHFGQEMVSRSTRSTMYCTGRMVMGARGTRPPSDTDPLSEIDRVLDRSHLLPPGTIESVMKGMHDTSAP